jgi:hypothetical protein
LTLNTRSCTSVVPTKFVPEEVPAFPFNHHPEFGAASHRAFHVGSEVSKNPEDAPVGIRNHVTLPVPTTSSLYAGNIVPTPKFHAAETYVGATRLSTELIPVSSVISEIVHHVPQPVIFECQAKTSSTTILE